MVTARQKKALSKIVENGGNVSRAMLDAGYSPNTAKTPQKLTDSVGFTHLCDELGLTDELLLTALVEDLREKKGNRKAELELGFKIKGYLNQRANIDHTINAEKINGMRIVFDGAFSERKI